MKVPPAPAWLRPDGIDSLPGVAPPREGEPALPVVPAAGEPGSDADCWLPLCPDVLIEPEAPGDEDEDELGIDGDPEALEGAPDDGIEGLEDWLEDAEGIDGEPDDEEEGDDGMLADDWDCDCVDSQPARTSARAPHPSSLRKPAVEMREEDLTQKTAPLLVFPLLDGIKTPQPGQQMNLDDRYAGDRSGPHFLACQALAGHRCRLPRGLLRAGRRPPQRS